MYGQHNKNVRDDVVAFVAAIADAGQLPADLQADAQCLRTVLQADTVPLTELEQSLALFPSKQAAVEMSLIKLTLEFIVNI